MSYPELILNSYMWKQFELAKPSIYANYSNLTPFFPISDIKAGDTAWGRKPYVVYDSFTKARTARKYFFPVKAGQMMYSIKGNISDIFEWRDFMINVLDREDVAAKDVNEYAGEYLSNTRIFFHCINASQTNYVYNTTEQQGQNKMYSANLVVKYDYHITDIYNA